MSDDFNERQLVGILCIHQHKIPDVELPLPSLTNATLRKILSAILDCHYNGETFIPARIAKEAGVDIGFLTRLVDEAEPTANVGYYAAEIAKAYRVRQACDTITSMVKDVESGADPCEVLATAAVTIDRIQSNGKAKDFGLIPASQFALQNHTVNYLVDGTVAEAQSLLVAAAEKNFKTTTAIDLGISGATGLPFFGQFQVNEPFTVLMFSGESGGGKLTQTIEAVCRAKGITTADLGRFIVTTEIPQLGSPEDVLAVRRQINRHGAKMIIIDPAYLCMAGAELSNIFAQGELLRPMNDVCRDAGTVFCLVHHISRGRSRDNFEPPKLSDVSGAGFPEFFRSWLLLGKREPDPIDVRQYKLWLVAGGSAGHRSTWALDVDEGHGNEWNVAIARPGEALQAAEDSKREQHRRRESERLMGFVKSAKKVLANGPLSKTHLRERIGANTKDIGLVIDMMVEAGEIEPIRITVGNNNRSVEGFALTAEEADRETKRANFSEALAAYNGGANGEF